RSELSGLGIPDSAVVVSVERPPHALAGYWTETPTTAPPFVTLLNSRVDPVRGGLGVSMSSTDSTVHRGPCTLSVVAVPQVFAPNAIPDYSGPQYAITVSHCTPTIGLNDGSIMGQPTTSFLDRIGQEVVDPPLFTNAVQPRCPVNRQCRWSDAA